MPANKYQKQNNNRRNTTPIIITKTHTALYLIFILKRKHNNQYFSRLVFTLKYSSYSQYNTTTMFPLNLILKLVLCSWKAVFTTWTSLKSTGEVHRSRYRFSQNSWKSRRLLLNIVFSVTEEQTTNLGMFWRRLSTCFLVFNLSLQYHWCHAKGLLSGKWSRTQVVFRFSSRSWRNFHYPFISQQVSLCHLGNLTLIACL